MAILGCQNSVTTEMIDLKFGMHDYVSDFTSYAQQCDEMYISCTFFKFLYKRFLDCLSIKKNN